MIRSSLRRLNADIDFFFQAEDGIRDLTVTGVQTCALPIFVHVGRSAVVAGKFLTEKGFVPADVLAVQNMIRCTGVDANLQSIPFQSPLEKTRSEERRVGKECRSRWSPYH